MFTRFNLLRSLILGLVVATAGTAPLTVPAPVQAQFVAVYRVQWAAYDEFNNYKWYWQDFTDYGQANRVYQWLVDRGYNYVTFTRVR